MVCVKRKIRAKVVFFRELSEKCVKKAEESNYYAWHYSDSSSNRRVKNPVFFRKIWPKKGSYSTILSGKKGTFSVFHRGTSVTKHKQQTNHRDGL